MSDTNTYKEKLPKINSKLPDVGTSIFTVMSALASEHQAINLSQGFPDFPCDPQLVDLVTEMMKKGMNQYAPGAGLPILRNTIAEVTKKHYKADYNPDTEITITAGATEALYSSITALIRPGDEVIVFEPYYDSYVPAILLNGGIPIYVPLQYPHYSIDWDMVKKQISHRTRAIMINSPHNPSGQILNHVDMMELSSIASSRDIFIISDEVYENIIFDNSIHNSVCLYPELASRSIMIGSFGKTLHVTGWKIGYTLAPENIMREFRKIHQFNTFSTGTPMQAAIAEYIRLNPDLFTKLKTMYEGKRDLFARLMKNTRFTPLPVDGTYFQLYSYKNISEEGDYDFCVRLTKEHGVAAIPVSAFYHTHIDNKVIRFCFAKDDNTLDKAVDKLTKI